MTRTPKKQVGLTLSVSVVERLDTYLKTVSITRNSFIEQAIIEKLDKVDLTQVALQKLQSMNPEEIITMLDSLADSAIATKEEVISNFATKES